MQACILQNIMFLNQNMRKICTLFAPKQFGIEYMVLLLFFGADVADLISRKKHR